jgi:hypothetical protein
MLLASSQWNEIKTPEGSRSTMKEIWEQTSHLNDDNKGRKHPAVNSQGHEREGGYNERKVQEAMEKKHCKKMMRYPSGAISKTRGSNKELQEIGETYDRSR